MFPSRGPKRRKAVPSSFAPPANENLLVTKSGELSRLRAPRDRRRSVSISGSDELANELISEWRHEFHHAGILLSPQAYCHACEGLQIEVVSALPSTKCHEVQRSGLLTQNMYLLDVEWQA